MNERGVGEVMYEAIEPGLAEYSDIVRKLQAAGIEVLYYAGFSAKRG